MGDLASSYAASRSSSQSSVDSDEREPDRGSMDRAVDNEDEIRVVSITPARDTAADANSLIPEQAQPSGPDGDLADIATFSSALETWVKSALELRDVHDIHFTENLRRNPKFQNPSVCAKMIAFCGLDEHGTNLKQGDSKVDPNIGHAAFYDSLGERQQKLAEERAVKEQRSKNPT
jgi:hypothetical protein